MRALFFALLLLPGILTAQGIELRTADTLPIGAGTRVNAFLTDKQRRIVQPVSTGTILWRSVSPVLRITRVLTGAVDIVADQVGTGKIIASWWNQGRTWFDTVSVVVVPLPPVNRNPTAAFQTTCVPGKCVFSAAASSDIDGDPLTFTWRAVETRSEKTGMVIERFWFGANEPGPNEFDQRLVVADGRGGTDSISYHVIIPEKLPLYRMVLTASRDTVVQRPAPGQSDGTHFSIVQADVRDTASVQQSAADVVFTYSDTAAATYTRNPTDGSLVVSDPVKNATVTIQAQYARNGFTAMATYNLVLVLRALRATSITVAVSDSSLVTYDSTQASAAVLDQWGAILSTTVTWRSSDTTVLRVSSSGQVTALREGTATVIATAGSVTGGYTLTTLPPPVVSLDVGFDRKAEVLWPNGIGTYALGQVLCARVTVAGTQYLGDKAIQMTKLPGFAGDTLTFVERPERDVDLSKLCAATPAQYNSNAFFYAQDGTDTVTVCGVFDGKIAWPPVLLKQLPADSSSWSPRGGASLSSMCAKAMTTYSIPTADSATAPLIDWRGAKIVHPRLGTTLWRPLPSLVTPLVQTYPVVWSIEKLRLPDEVWVPVVRAAPPPLH